jgi:hypothetical protein
MFWFPFFEGPKKAVSHWTREIREIPDGAKKVGLIIDPSLLRSSLE